MQGQPKLENNHIEKVIASSHAAGMGFKNKFREAVEGAVAAVDKKYTRVSGPAGVDQASMSRFINSGQGLSLDNVAKLVDYLGGELVFPKEHDPSRDVCFVCPTPPSGSAQEATPLPEDYLAVPLAEEPVAAGPGLLPQDSIEGWVLVYRDHPGVRYKRNLVAVKIGQRETSMLPLFSPGDILLVDRDDKEPDPPGRIMLVTDPDGGAAIKRVSVARDDGDYSITFYSDNARDNPPRTHKLRRDYDGDMRRAIAGHVVWAWSDVRHK